MNKEELKAIVESDILGLLDETNVKSRWGIVARHGCEIPTTKKKALNSYKRAIVWSEEYKKTGYVGCIYREVFKDNEWQLTATEEF